MNTARSSISAGIPHASPQADASAMSARLAPVDHNSARAVHWLSQQSIDLMDACLMHVSAAESTALGGPWLAAADAARAQRSNLTARLAASSHHHLISDVTEGPLRQAIVSGLDMSGHATYDASNWLRIPQWRDALFAERDELHIKFLAGAYFPHENVPKDNTTAILAIDQLDDASPMRDVDWNNVGIGRPSWQQQQDRRISGYAALLLASSFSEPMQHSLLAHVIVSTALAFVGMETAAIDVAREAVQVRLPQDLLQDSSRNQPLSYGYLRGHDTAPGQQAIVWLKAAALAADAPELAALQAQGEEMLQPLQQMQVAFSEGRRWVHLERHLPLWHNHFQAWCRSVGKDCLIRFFTHG